jgi:MYXO-CTERM domain-containing protein
VDARELVSFDHQGGALVPRFADGVPPDLTARLRERADQPFELQRKGTKVTAILRDAAPVAPREEHGQLVYDRAVAGGTLVHSVSRGISEETVRFEARPSQNELVYDVTLSGAAGLRLVDGVLELLRGDGDPVIRTKAPTIVDANGVVRGGTLTVEGCAYDTSVAPPWGRPVTAPGTDRCTLHFAWDDRELAYPIVVDPAWTPTSSMVTSRYRHRAAEVVTASGACTTGCVLVTGGLTSVPSGIGTIFKDQIAGTAELYNEASGTWTTTGAIPFPSGVTGIHSHISLSLGATVLVAGGSTATTTYPTTTGTFSYDPVTGAWTTLPAMPHGRSYAAAAALASGAIYVTGGFDNNGTVSNAVDIFSPSSKAWGLGPIPTLATARAQHVMALDGSTFVVAGGVGAGGADLASIETSTGGTATWSTSSSTLQLARRLSTAAALPVPCPPPPGICAFPRPIDVFVFGGMAGTGASSDVDQITATGGAGTYTALAVARGEPCSAAYKGGLVILGGDVKPPSPAILRGTSELFRAAATIPMNSPRNAAQATPLQSGKVLATGGFELNAATNTAEIFDIVQKGGTCTTDSECATAHCSDGVCCDTACNSPCDVCSKCLGASADGTCTTAPEGTPGNAASNSTCTAPATSCCQLGKSCSTSPAGIYLCDGTNVTCPGTCANDKDCAIGYYCSSGGTCTAALAQGTKCDEPTQCKSAPCAICTTGNCVDGYCCDKGCGGTCRSCGITGSTGTCSNVVGADDPDTCPSATSTCVAGASASVCLFKNGYPSIDTSKADPACTSGTQCASGFCVDGTCCGTGSDGKALTTAACGTCESCADDKGQCQAVKGTTDADTCTTTSSCDATGKCKLDQGQACSDGTQCLSGNCVDNVCCNTPCTATCQACAATLQEPGGVDGTCGNAKAGTSDSLCTKTTACGFTGICGTGGQCAKAASGTVCGSPTCDKTGLNASDPSVCDGNGNCGNYGTPINCNLYVCDTTASTPGFGSCFTSCTSNTQCSTKSFCDATGACGGLKTQGQLCTNDTQCGTGNCVDGVCCNTPCTDACQACAKTLKQDGSADGTCGPAKLGTTDAQCMTQAATSCGTTGACNALGGCAFFAQGTTCGSDVCVGNVSETQTCNGSGACTTGQTSIDCVKQYNSICSAGTGQCFASCTVDAQCAPGNYCDVASATCLPKKTDGTACAAPNECFKGYCADGVCCDRGCSGCNACTAALTGGTDGICAAALTGTDPHDACSADSPSTCGQTGQCDNGACGFYNPATLCGPPACIGTQSFKSVCSSPFSCTPTGPSTDCTPYACQTSTGQCLKGCQVDTDCAAGKYCSAGACVTQKTIGTACGADDECAGLQGAKQGFCTDGVCCSDACAGPCQACSLAKKGQGIDGQCDAIAAGTDPDNECSSALQTSCGNDGFCDGKGVCELWAAGTDCSATPGANVCSGNKLVGQICDGLGTCTNSTTGVDCAPQKCVSGACSACVTSTDCLDPNATYCDSSGTCRARKAQGESCGTGDECLSTFCVDGVCCSEVCDKQCEWCGDPTQPGVCLAVPEGQPKNGRTACPGAGATPCGSECDGAKRDGCVYPGASKTCAPAQCENDWIVTAGTCDNSAGCTPGKLTSCGTFTCDATASACKTACTTTRDCRRGAVCDTSTGTETCNASGATCVGVDSVKDTEGTVSSCNGYLCLNGQCQQQCGSDADCATGSGYRCVASACVVFVVGDDAGSGAGGTTASGGATGASGATGTGAASASGGATASGGTTSAGTGGAPSGSGATTASGGALATDAGLVTSSSGGAQAVSQSKDSGGCGCRVTQRERASDPAGLGALAVLGIAALRRRRGPRPGERRRAA